MRKRTVPRMVFFTSGVGVDEDELMSFELALRNAGIEKFNLVPVSSILPPKCRVVKKETGLKRLKPGEIVYCVMARFCSSEEGKEIFASVAAAIPDNDKRHGYIAEHCGYWYDGADKHAEHLAMRMLESSGAKKIKTVSTSVKAKVEKITTVVAAAVFVV